MKTRRLAALMFTDMVGYSATAHKDEWLARELVDDQRLIVREALARHGGIEHDTAGDGFFIEFASAVSAVECAMEVQSRLFDRNRFKAPERKIQLRIGLHLGDVGADDQDLFGNGVNLAARIEPLAPAGGICVTQQIFDQVEGKIEGLRFKKRGHHKLKNIAAGAVIYSVVSPWDVLNEEQNLKSAGRKLKRLPFFENMSSVLGAGLFALCFACLVIALATSLSSGETSVFRSSRLPASVVDARVDLTGGWFYQVAKDQSVALSEQKPIASEWREFDPKKSWRYSDLIQGKYWLRRTLSGQTALTTPAIVLGLISDKHRAFLNGQFIGGSDRTSDLALYPFDPTLLTSGENELLIEGETRPSLNPGLVSLGTVGTFLGDFSEARSAIAKNELQFGLLRTIYFVLSVLIFGIAFVYSVFRKQSRAYFYYAFVLLLGSLQLAYFSPLLTAAFDYPFTRFLKIIGLILSPLILHAAFVSQVGRKREEFWTTVIAAAATGVAAFALFKLPATTTEFTSNYNLLLAAGLSFCFVGVVKLGVDLRGRNKNELIIRGIFTVFQLIGALTILASFKQGWSTVLLPNGLRDSGFWLSLACPLLFAIAVLSIAVVDHIRESHRAREKQNRDEFALDVLHTIHITDHAETAVFKVHKKLSKYVGATRSTLYLVDSAQELSFTTVSVISLRRGPLRPQTRNHIGSLITY